MGCGEGGGGSEEGKVGSMDEQMAAAGILMLATTEEEKAKKPQRSDGKQDNKQDKLRRRGTRSLFRMVVDVPAKHFGLDIPGFYYRWVARLRSLNSRGYCVLAAMRAVGELAGRFSQSDCA